MMTEEQKQERIESLTFRLKTLDLLEEDGIHIDVVERDSYRIALAELTQPASPALRLPDEMDADHPRMRWVGIDKLWGRIQGWNDCLEEVKRLNAPHTAPIEPICATGGAEWVKVSDGLPKRGQRVNAFYLNRLGKGRTIRAEYIYSKTEEAGECDPDTQCVEYCEESDTYFVTEGWYEVMDNWEEYGSIAVTEGDVTHWMPLPAAPTS